MALSHERSVTVTMFEIIQTFTGTMHFANTNVTDVNKLGYSMFCAGNGDITSVQFTSM